MPDLTVCPGCGGEADNGFDRCFPPNPYYCKKCHDIESLQSDLRTMAEAVRDANKGYASPSWKAHHAPAITLAQGILEEK